MNIYKNIMIVFILSSSLSSYSQVVINNKDDNTAGGVFHIDGAQDNSATPTPSEIENDIFVDDQGRLGVGTITPSKQLHIQTNATSSIPMRIRDGSQAKGRVFTSNAYGQARWQQFGAIPVISIPLGAQLGFTTSSISGKFIYTNTPIKLPPGLWLVEVNILVYKNGGTSASDFTPKIWVKSLIADSKTGQTPTKDSYGPGSSGRYACDFVYLKGSAYNMINGYFIINNKSGSDKIYYYMFGNCITYGTIPSNATFLFGGPNNESTIYATYIDEAKP